MKHKEEVECKKIEMSEKKMKKFKNWNSNRKYRRNEGKLHTCMQKDHYYNFGF